MSPKTNVVLWVVQSLLAALFLFAGGMKLAAPLAALAQQSPLPVPFMKFVGLAEVCGAIGLLLPGLTGIARRLTSYAALGLTGLMTGAIVVTLQAGGGAGAMVPLMVGALAATIAWARRAQLG